MADTGTVTEADLARLRSKFDAVKRSENSTRWASRLVAVIVAAVAITGVWLLVQPIYSAYKQPEPYNVAFKKEFDDNLMPALRTEAQKMFAEVGPEVGEMARAKFEERMDEISQTLQSETQTLFANLSEHAQGVHERLPEIEGRIYERVQTHVPQLADQDAASNLAVSANEAINVALARVMDEHFHAHVEAAAEFGEKLRGFPVNDGLKSMTDHELREHLKNTLAAYAAHHFETALSPQLKQFAMGYQAE